MGATGTVGAVMLDVIRERGLAVDELVPFASARSAGKTISFGDEQLEVQALTPESI